MTSRSADICTLCTDDGISNNAITWCTECEVFLCTDCEKHHKRSKASKEHRTMRTVDYRNLPQFMQETSNRCKDHDKKYELYCSFHSCPCCIQCIASKHQKCQDLKPLDDILKDFKSSAAVPILKKDLTDLRESLEEVMRHLRDKIKTIHIQKSKCIQEVRTTRKLLNDYFDKLEREILDDLKSQHSKLASDMEALVQQMENRAKRVDQMQEDFSTMTKYATELQTYIGLREIEKTTSQEAKYLDELESGSQLNDMEITVSSTVKSVLQDVKSLGNISVKSLTKSFQTKTGRKDQAQHLVPMVHGIEQIKPSLLNSLRVPNGESLKLITCQILPDGTLLLFHYKQNSMIQYNSDGTFMKELMTFKEQPYDVCFVKDNTVAVTLYRATKVLLVDVEKNKLIKTIKLAHGCYGVSSDGEVMIISHKEARKIIILNLKDMSEDILEGIRVHRISLFKGNIYGTYYYEDRVDCYRITGELLWTFTHEDIYQPEGIAVDMNGFVYITSCGKDRIVVLSSDGKISRTVLCKEDGILEPYAIDINKELGTMLVACCVDKKGSAFIFKI
ncbi:uncharacterized protein LOC127720607 [Mytilus californianus]|uniref:uncharacterized protein LOC127720607 n=1 Tax=Mytilus californianus TaxID=6549 RepID=UPI002247BB48|nr:uncharacterized protein LOC127720607 [Mytilus californianus]